MGYLDDINGAGSGPIFPLCEGVDMGEPTDSLPLKPRQLGQNMLTLCTCSITSSKCALYGDRTLCKLRCLAFSAATLQV